MRTRAEANVTQKPVLSQNEQRADPDIKLMCPDLGRLIDVVQMCELQQLEV